MQRRGHHVTAVAPACDAVLQQRFAACGVRFIPIPMQRTGLNPLKDMQMLYALLRQMRNVRPDCVLAYTIKPVLYSMLAARLSGIKNRFALITGLGYAFTESGERHKRRWMRLLLSLLYRVALVKAAGVIFQNSDDQALFRSLRLVASSQPCHVVHGSGINLIDFSPTTLPEAPVFLMIARLLRDKGVREYAAAVRLLKTSHPNAICRLVGALDDNPSAIRQDELDTWVREGLIDYLGVLSDIRPAMVNASVYVLPSYREGTPRSVLEAMAMGRPIITTDVPGCRETVKHGDNGLLVPPRDASALAEAMRTLAATASLRATMGQKSRKYAEEKFDVCRVNDDMLRILGLN